MNCKKVNIEVIDVKLAKSRAGTAIRKTESDNVKLIIQLNQNHDERIKYATLCHELAHLFLGHLGGDPNGKEWTSRIGLTLTQRELEAESVSYILCVRSGLETNSDEYLSGYIKNPDDIKKISIEAIMKAVTYIESMTQKYFHPRKSVKAKS